MSEEDVIGLGLGLALGTGPTPTQYALSTQKFFKQSDETSGFQARKSLAVIPNSF